MQATTIESNRVFTRNKSAMDHEKTQFGHDQEPGRRPSYHEVDVFGHEEGNTVRQLESYASMAENSILTLSTDQV